MIAAKIIEDSINTVTGDRITTFLWLYPRMIHSEIMTHRKFSRNAASSRAIPIEKVMKEVLERPARPVFWGANQKGMVADVELPTKAAAEAIRLWDEAGRAAVEQARKFQSIITDEGTFSVHKQIVNRIMEPWAHMLTLVTATEYTNFFALRVEPNAQPEFQCLATKTLQLYLTSTPRPLNAGDWHTPFGDMASDSPDALKFTDMKLKIATGRAARTSYKTIEGSVDVVKDMDLHDRLIANHHMSPTEHCAKAMAAPGQSGNFSGWEQYRKMIPNENIKDVDLWDRLASAKKFNYDDNLNNVWPSN